MFWACSPISMPWMLWLASTPVMTLSVPSLQMPSVLQLVTWKSWERHERRTHPDAVTGDDGLGAAAVGGDRDPCAAVPECPEAELAGEGGATLQEDGVARLQEPVGDLLEALEGAGRGRCRCWRPSLRGRGRRCARRRRWRRRGAGPGAPSAAAAKRRRGGRCCGPGGWWCGGHRWGHPGGRGPPHVGCRGNQPGVHVQRTGGGSVTLGEGHWCNLRRWVTVGAGVLLIVSRSPSGIVNGLVQYTPQFGAESADWDLRAAW